MMILFESGSIGGNRIKREHVKPTVDKFIEDVLKGFNGYKSCEISGSYNAGTKTDHGDIDLIVWIDGGSDLKQLKKDFKKYIEELPDEVCPRFRSEKYKGQKAKIYGTIVTCQVPIVGKEEDFVQVDCCICNTKDEASFKKSFLDLEASKQALITGLVRILDDKKKEAAFKKFGIQDLPILADDGSEEFEFVLSTAGLSLRKIKLDSNRKQTGKQEIWRSCKWEDVVWLLEGWDLSKTYDELLDITAKKITDKRSRSRLCGVMKSMVVVNPGEENTPKGDAKVKSIEDIYKKLDIRESLKNEFTDLSVYISNRTVNKLNETLFYNMKSISQYLNESLMDKQLNKVVAAVVNDFTEMDNGYKQAEYETKDGVLHVYAINEDPSSNGNIHISVELDRTGYNVIVVMTDRDPKKPVKSDNTKGGASEQFMLAKNEGGKLEGKIYDTLEKVAEDYKKI